MSLVGDGRFRVEDAASGGWTRGIRGRLPNETALFGGLEGFEAGRRS